MPSSSTRRRPASSAGVRTLRRFAGDARKGWGRVLRRHPSVGVVVSIVLAVVGLILLMVGLLAENLLYFLAMGLSALGSVATARASHLERQRQAMKGPPKVSRPAGPRRPPADPPAAGPRPPSGPVKCADTGRAASECDCATRHVVTAEGAKRYGLPIGSPIGKRKKPAKAATL